MHTKTSPRRDEARQTARKIGPAGRTTLAAAAEIVDDAAQGFFSYHVIAERLRILAAELLKQDHAPAPDTAAESAGFTPRYGDDRLAFAEAKARLWEIRARLERERHLETADKLGWIVASLAAALMQTGAGEVVVAITANPADGEEIVIDAELGAELLLLLDEVARG